MTEEKIYDTALIGGGLAGLCAAVLLAKKGHSVILFEKEKYPFQKVCGEYISMESWDFLLNEIGLALNEMNLPKITKLEISAPNGSVLKSDLDLGGFGISRLKIDNLIKEIAVSLGVAVMDGTKVDDISFKDEIFLISTKDKVFKSKTCCGSWGKRSNLDIKWKRAFITKKNDRLNNYVGIKYHIKADLPKDTIYLHNFKDGYCGCSKIEDDLYCLCWFSKARNLKAGERPIENAEEKILSQNPALKSLFNRAEKVNRQPVAVSQVSLSKKSPVENHVLMIGDAAGMISPLCGNGMSIAMHSAKLAAIEVNEFLSGKISREKMELNYAKNKTTAFGKRIKVGRIIQSFFGGKMLTNIFIGVMGKSGWMKKKIIGLTHGKKF